MTQFKIAKWNELNAEQKKGFMQTMADAGMIQGGVAAEMLYKLTIEKNMRRDSDSPTGYKGLCMLRDGKPVASLVYIVAMEVLSMHFAASPYTGAVKEFLTMSEGSATARTPMDELVMHAVDQNPNLDKVWPLEPSKSARSLLDRMVAKGWLNPPAHDRDAEWTINRSNIPKPLNLEETQLRAAEVGVLEQKVAVKPGARRRNTN